jgi:hypothetical protein
VDGKLSAITMKISKQLLWVVGNPLKLRFRVPALICEKFAIPRVRQIEPLDALAVFVLALYLVFTFVLFFSWVEPSLRGTGPWRIGADSGTYQDIADVFSDDSVLLSPTQNLLGPVLLAIWLKSSFLIALFNTGLLVVSLLMLRRTRLWVFLFWVLWNPLTFSALTTLNKEIFALLSAVSFWRWLQHKRWTWICIALLSSCFTRWEQFVVIILFLSMLRIKHRGYAIILLLIVLSAACYLGGRLLVSDYPIGAQSAVTDALTWVSLQGFYFLAFPIRLLVALTSQVMQFWVPFLDTRRFYDMQTGMFLLGNQLCMCLMLFLLWLKSLLTLSNDASYFLAIFAVTYCAAPLNQPRYFYFCYIFAAMMLADTSSDSRRASVPIHPAQLAALPCAPGPPASRVHTISAITLLF